MWHRITPVFALLFGCFGCDQPVPSVAPGEDGGVVVYPDGGIEPPQPLADGPIEHRFEPAGSQPSDGWTSPIACVPGSDTDYCAVCWAWSDGGPWSLDRNEVDDRFGAALAGGDFNDDGYPDLAVGAPGEKVSEAGEGVVYLFLGSERGFQPWRRIESQDLGLAPIFDLGLGTALAVGDFDVDGFDDLVIALNTAGPGNEPLLGFAMGSPNGPDDYFTVSLSEIDPSGSTAAIPLGHALAVGDFDGDDDDDLAISAPDYNLVGYSGAGAVFTILGGSYMAQGPRIDLDDGGYPVKKYVNFGHSLATYPMGVGTPDRLVIGAPGDGEIYLYDYGAYYGPYTSSLGIESFGVRLAVGDLDKDGYPDVVASGYGAPVVEVVSTGASIWSNDPRGSREFFPLAIADFDLDGLQDLVLVSVPESGGWDNYLYFAGGNGSLVPDTPMRIKTESEPWDDLGRAVFVQDIDGDWSPDLVVGAPVQDASGAGRVYAFTQGGGGVDPWFDGQSQMVHQELALDGCDICAVHEWSDGTVCDGGLGNEICVASSCVARGCGDGYRQTTADPWPREACDDGNTLNDDACSSTCASQLLVVASDDLTADAPSRLPPSVAGDGRDHVLFAYLHDHGETRTLLARTYSAAGTPEQEIASPLIVATLPGVGWDAQPTVAGLASGGWVVAWTDPDLDGAGSGIAYRLVGTDGSLSPVQIANEDTRGQQLEPRVAALSTGFLVVWTDAGGFDGPLGRSLIQARRFSASGAPLEDEWPVSDPALTSNQPALASNGDDFFVVWTDLPDGEGSSTSRLWARRFGAEEDATPFEVTSNGMEASAGWLEYGLYVVSWTSRMADYRGDIRLAMVSPTSTPLVYTEMEFAVTAASETASSVGASGDHCVLAYETGGRRRGLAWQSVNGTFPSLETSTLLSHLTGQLEGDVTVAGTSRGLWFAWSDAGDTTTDAYRSFLAFLLPVD